MVAALSIELLAEELKTNIPEIDFAFLGLDHHLDHRVGWVERSETQHFVFVGFRSSTQPTFHALAETMIKATTC